MYILDSYKTSNVTPDHTTTTTTAKGYYDCIFNWCVAADGLPYHRKLYWMPYYNIRKRKVAFFLAFLESGFSAVVVHEHQLVFFLVYSTKKGRLRKVKALCAMHGNVHMYTWVCMKKYQGEECNMCNKKN